MELAHCSLALMLLEQFAMSLNPQSILMNQAHRHFPDWICPHCLGPNEAFGPARCQHCHLHMLSEQEQVMREQRARPAALYLQLHEGLLQEPSEKIQPLLQDLSLLERLQPAWSEWLQPVKAELAQRQNLEASFRQQWRLHLLVLGLLILAPLLAILANSDRVLIGLLCLPIVGWTWIGLIEFRRRKKP